MSPVWNFLILSAPAFAADEPTYCTSLPRVLEQAPFCEENVRFLTEAQSCLRKFDQEILVARTALNTSFLARGTANRAAQDAKFEDHNGNLGDAARSFAFLLADASRARTELVAYLEALRFPGDPLPSLRERKNLDGYLGAFPCYHDRREALLQGVTYLDQRIADLRRARGADVALAAAAGTRGASLKIDNQSVKGGIGESSRKPSTAAPTGAFTITGRIQSDPLP
jgi:hypothetical protein